MPRCPECNRLYAGADGCPFCSPKDEPYNDISLANQGWDSNPLLDIRSHLQEIRDKESLHIDNVVVDKRVDKSVIIRDSIVSRSNIGGADGSVDEQDSIINRSDVRSTRDVIKDEIKKGLATVEASIGGIRKGITGHEGSNEQDPKPTESDKPVRCPTCGAIVDIDDGACCGNCGRFL